MNTCFRIALIASLALGTACAGCCKKKAERPVRQSSTEHDIGKGQLFEEQKRIAAGEKVGEELARPTIAVGPGEVKVNGTMVTDAVLPQGEPAPVNALRDWLKMDREHYKMLYAGVQFPGNAAVQIEPGLDAFVALSVIHTVSSAGFAQSVTAGGNRLELPMTTAAVSRSAWLRFGGPDGTEVRFEGGCELPREAGTYRNKESMQKALEQVCSLAASPCFQELVIQPAAADKWAATAEWIAAVLAAPSVRKAAPFLRVAASNGVRVQQAPGLVEANAREPGCTEARVLHPKPGCETAKFKPRILFGAITSTGGFTDTELRKELESRADPLKSCITAELCSDPKLYGRQLVELQVLPGGQPMHVRTVSADLPSTGVIRCIEAAFHGMKFPPRDKPTEVKVAFLFTPE